MAAVTIPVAAEVLVNRPASPPLVAYPSTDPDPAWGTWGGSSPRLETPDYDARYGEITAYEFAQRRGVGIRLGPWAPASFAPVEAWIDYQAFAPEPVRWGTLLATTFAGSGSFTSNNAESDAVNGWRTGRLSLPFVSIPILWTNFLAAVAASNVVAYCLPTNPGGTAYTGAFKVSWLRLVLSDGADPTLRQVHRDDGRGITPRRARGASSRNTTNRARAYD